MLEQKEQNESYHRAEARKPHYDLVVVGAGIAGLNALHAASVYLPKSARVLLVDEKAKPGGMWTVAYDYVRLHQPHPLFTVGNMRWNWRNPRQYLAARDEVQAHLARCLETIGRLLTLEQLFGYVATDIKEVAKSGRWSAEVYVHPTGRPHEIICVEANRVIHASGFNYQVPERMWLSSRQVLSITPSELRETLSTSPNAPVHVVGGGKTGLDTVLEILNENNDRPVSLINGNGSYYLNRTKFFPTGIRRWVSGALAAQVFRDCVIRFDGRNEEVVRKHFIANYATNPDPRSMNYIYGLLAEDENQRIEAGLREKIWDYLDDVVDAGSGPQMVMRSGKRFAVEQGCIFVNCTGSLMRNVRPEDWKPCLSPKGVILSVNTRHAMHILTTYASFMLSHLYFNGRLRTSGLYFLDLEALLRKSKVAFTAATMTQSYHNLLLSLKNLDMDAHKCFGIDFNRWYPTPRRLLVLNAIRKNAREDIQHCRKSLDVIVDRFGIVGGQIE